MPVSLLDINVLIALAWPNHQHHHAAHMWFVGQTPEQFATCPMTQCGFVRISSNPKIIPDALSTADAVVLLQRITTHLDHVFWQDDIELSDPAYIRSRQLRGHRQVTDAYLFGLCLKRGGRFATFDAGVMSLAANKNEVASILVISG
jgi:toxin-antitoxin system PIN domain toxin